MRYIQAKAALQAGLRKGNARERPVVNRHEKESHAHRSSGVNSQDVQRYFQVYSYIRTSNLKIETLCPIVSVLWQNYVLHPSESLDMQKGRKSRQLPDGQSASRASSSVASPTISSLIIPSLKEVMCFACSLSLVVLSQLDSTNMFVLSFKSLHSLIHPHFWQWFSSASAFAKTILVL